ALLRSARNRAAHRRACRDGILHCRRSRESARFAPAAGGARPHAAGGVGARVCDLRAAQALRILARGDRQTLRRFTSDGQEISRQSRDPLPATLRGNEVRLNAEILEEAANWLIELNSTHPSPRTRREFDTWLRRSPEHVRAY